MADLSLKARLTKISVFPNSENRTLPLFSKDLKLSNLKREREMKLEMKFMDVFSSLKSLTKGEINK